MARMPCVGRGRGRDAKSHSGTRRASPRTAREPRVEHAPGGDVGKGTRGRGEAPWNYIERNIIGGAVGGREESRREATINEPVIAGRGRGDGSGRAHLCSGWFWDSTSTTAARSAELRISSFLESLSPF